jgi:4-diphosphocytidyl-2C-methyl-D-erythritol kinase
LREVSEAKSNSDREFLKTSLEAGQTKEGNLGKKRKHGTFHQRFSGSGHHCMSTVREKQQTRSFACWTPRSKNALEQYRLFAVH